MSKRIKKTDYVALAEFRYALRKFFRFSEEAAEGLGIEPKQYQALLAVQGFPGRERITIGELAEQLQIRHHSAVGLVNRTVTEGLLKREVGVEDRREVYVILTSKGKDVLENLATAHREELRQFGPQIKAFLERP